MKTTEPRAQWLKRIPKLSESAQFFFDQAGFSWDPKKETEHEGRLRCAQQLANAEAHAKRVGLSFEWSLDDITSQEFSDEKPYYQLWVCVAWRGNKVVGSCGGIDFGRGGQPSGNPYKRVMEAELSLEDYHEALNQLDAECRDIQTV